MLTEISIFFLGFITILFVVVLLAYGTFMAVWKTFSVLQENTGSFVVAFSAAFFLASFISYLAIVFTYLSIASSF